MTDSIQSLVEDLRAEADRDRDPDETPDVGVVMGSDSDLEVMFGAYEALTGLGFDEVTDYDDPPEADYTFETYVVSAHRTPDLMFAGAGGKSADLPNMTASIAYPLPVIGVPVQEKSVDSVIGMPTGAPITAVDAGKSFNAALSAVQVLARKHPDLEDALEAYHEELREGVGEDSRSLHELGTVAYRESMAE